MCENKSIDIKLKEFEQNMNTYRYLGEMNVKYFMFFLIVAGISLKVYLEAAKPIYPILGFFFFTGIYVSYSIYLVYARMESLAVSIGTLSEKLKMQTQNFTPFLSFLKLTCIVVAVITLTMSYGMLRYHT